jgi:hypothetical protein
MKEKASSTGTILLLMTLTIPSEMIMEGILIQHIASQALQLSLCSVLLLCSVLALLWPLRPSPLAYSQMNTSLDFGMSFL